MKTAIRFIVENFQPLAPERFDVIQSGSISPTHPDAGLQAPSNSDDSSGWRGVQADHHDRMAKLSDAYAAAYEGDVQFATARGQRTYLVQRARRHRKDAQLRRATAQQLRSFITTRSRQP
jgi:hypothetical protein